MKEEGRERRTDGLLLRNAGVFSGEARKPVLAGHAVHCALGRIVRVLPEAQLRPEDVPAGIAEVDCGGALVTPGLIDCHTHLVYGGDRAAEFEQRLSGASYAEIAAAGGGIMSTVRATRAATDEELRRSASARLAALLREGVTTVEIKSGYGLTTEDELRMLRVARSLEKSHAVSIETTQLAAHAVPAEYRDRREEYVALVCEEILPRTMEERLARTADVFCESGAFTLAETDRIFRAARSLGMRVRVHAEQFTASGAAKLAAQHGALSADHLEYLDEDGARALANAGTVAVLLPGAQLTLALPSPPIAALRECGAHLAIATDSNPGSSNTLSLLTMLQLAAVVYRLSPAECLAGATANAARALGIAERVGRIAPGMEADLALWDAASPVDIVYRLGANPLKKVWKRGRETTP